MGKRGPKPKPTAMKLLTGSWRAYENPLEPTAPKGFPVKPRYTSKERSDLWDEISVQLYNQGTLSENDGWMLDMLVRSRADYERFSLLIDKSGDLVRNGKKENPDAQFIPNPYIAMRDRAADRVMKLSAVFGLSPADRTRIHIERPLKPVGQVVDPVDELLDK